MQQPPLTLVQISSFPRSSTQQTTTTSSSTQPPLTNIIHNSYLKTNHLKPKQVFNLLHSTTITNPTNHCGCENIKVVSSNVLRVSSFVSWRSLEHGSLTINQNILPSKCTYKTNYNLNDIVASYKAVLAAQDFKQKHNNDYNETFSLAAK